jgi:hypothetical protein
MIDNFTLGLTHGLLLLAAWRLVFRPDLDDDTAPAPPSGAPRHGRWSVGSSKPEEIRGA